MLQDIRQGFLFFCKNVGGFLTFFFYYLKKKVILFSTHFEKNKNKLVKLFMMKRGRYNRPFLHIMTMSVLGLGVFIAPYIADSYPLTDNSTLLQVSAQTMQQSITVGENVFHTAESDKPRDEVLKYTVEKGDTLSTIAKKFNVSTETIQWANDMTGDDLTVGDSLDILPVTGVAHKVARGDTIYSIAKKYTAEPQAIADFTFNDFVDPEKFTLVEGQILIVPEGIKPSERPAIRREVYIAQGPVPVSPGGFTFPLRGGISQFASWYHMALDITGSYGAPIVSAHNGTVTSVNLGGWDGGYGNNVWISNGDGTESHYAHMTGSNVSVGQQVVGGKTVVGWVGMSGRTTGPHLHFEIRRNGALVNPLSYVQ